MSGATHRPRRANADRPRGCRLPAAAPVAALSLLVVDAQAGDVITSDAMTTTTTSGWSLAWRTLTAARAAGLRVDERMRLRDEEGAVLAESIDLTELARFLGTLALLGSERR